MGSVFCLVILRESVLNIFMLGRRTPRDGRDGLFEEDAVGDDASSSYVGSEEGDTLSITGRSG